jgi:hypothetical protein
MVDALVGSDATALKTFSSCRYGKSEDVGGSSVAFQLMSKIVCWCRGSCGGLGCALQLQTYWSSAAGPLPRLCWCRVDGSDAMARLNARYL